MPIAEKLIAEHEVFEVYLQDIIDDRDHKRKVLAFLARHTKSNGNERNLILLHNEGRKITWKGVAYLLGKTPEHTRKILKGLSDGEHQTGPRGALQFDIQFVCKYVENADIRPELQKEFEADEKILEEFFPLPSTPTT